MALLSILMWFIVIGALAVVALWFIGVCIGENDSAKADEYLARQYDKDHA